MTEKTKVVIRKYNDLTDKEKYYFFKSLDCMGGIETYTIGNQIDDFIDSIEGNEEDEEEDDEDEYYRSAEAGDYSPSHPWDAPGMSIKDFI